jgi:hypothetical protein
MAKDKSANTGKGGRQARREHQQARRQRSTWVGVGLVALVLVGAYVFWPRASVKPVAGGSLPNDPALGPPTAKVSLIEYGDFG